MWGNHSNKLNMVIPKAQHSCHQCEDTTVIPEVNKINVTNRRKQPQQPVLAEKNASFIIKLPETVQFTDGKWIFLFPR